ncbi:MAG: hypothetical protein JWR47_2674 [Phenylobacterium sp.]|nr:hypothetical protein [Phenylobacterium sp.]MDB5462169.1 hypothetical protein [Phenylobacterium sp.]
MDFLKDRRTLLALAGAAVALLAGLAIAWTLVGGHRGETPAPPPASRGGLVIDSAGAADGRMDPAKPLRCFVAGQAVGELTLAECAKRNGVSTDALDVGVDQTGALAAADPAGAMLTPLPPPQANGEEEGPAEVAPAPAPLPQVISGPPAVCWRYAEGQWRKLPSDMTLSACVQTLFAGRCERAGEAAYGRWAQQTLRLAPGRVEISADNHSFRTLMDQPGCATG